MTSERLKVELIVNIEYTLHTAGLPCAHEYNQHKHSNIVVGEIQDFT